MSVERFVVYRKRVSYIAISNGAFPVILDNQHMWQGQPGEEKRKHRRRRETPIQRALRRWRLKYPFISSFWLILIGVVVECRLNQRSWF